MQGILVHNAEVLDTVYKERLKLGVSGSLGSIGVSIIRIGFWAALWYSYNKETLRNNVGNYFGPYRDFGASPASTFHFLREGHIHDLAPGPEAERVLGCGV